MPKLIINDEYKDRSLHFCSAPENCTGVSIRKATVLELVLQCRALKEVLCVHYKVTTTPVELHLKKK